MAYTGKNPRTESAILTDQGVAAVVSPASGSHKIIDRNGQLYLKDSAGVETPVGSAGANGVNWVTNSNFEAATTGWATYADAAGILPVDGTGGSPSITFTRNTTNPLRGVADGKIAKDAANRQGQGVSTSITVDRGYAQSRSNSWTFLIDTTSANFLTGDLACYMYDITNSTVITPSVVYLPQNYRGPWTFSWPASTSTSYRPIFHIASTNALAWDVYIDEVNIGPGPQAVTTAPAAYIGQITPTINGFGTVTGLRCDAWRMGPYLKVLGRWVNGAAAGSAASIVLPAGYTIDYSALSTANTGIKVGSWTYTTTATTSISSNNAEGPLWVDGTTTDSIFFAYQTQSGAFRKDTGNGGVGSPSLTEIVEFMIPIAQWAGGTGYTGLADVEYAFNSSTTDADDTTTFGYGPAGTQFINVSAQRAKTVTFLTPILPTDDIQLQFSTDSGVTFKEVGTDKLIYPVSRQNTTLAGMTWQPASSTSIIVTIEPYRILSGSTFGNTGTTWSAIAASSQYVWRVRKIRGGSVAGFADASATASGLVNSTTQTFGGVKTFSGGVVVPTSGTSSGGAVFSGRYSPVITTTSNITGTPTCNGFMFTRVGNMVTVSGQLIATITAASGEASIQIPLPIASTFSGFDGSGCCVGRSYALQGKIESTNGSPGTMRVIIDAFNSAGVAREYGVVFMYEIK